VTRGWTGENCGEESRLETGIGHGGIHSEVKESDANTGASIGAEHSAPMRTGSLCKKVARQSRSLSLINMD
jgi:hypothetical protein